MTQRKIIVAGIGTDTGKTVASAILCQALNADYWKPVQAGDLTNTDAHKIEKWTEGILIHPEAYRLKQPMSPHAAAKLDEVEIDSKNLVIPDTANDLIIELAGGLMVPLSNDYLNIDWIEATQIPVVLVSNYYLGSINHTLLSLELLKARNVNCLGIIFNGEENRASKEVIMHRTSHTCLLEISMEQEITGEIIKKYASKIRI